MMMRNTLGLLLLVLLVAGMPAAPARADDQELPADRGSLPGYGAEHYRLVSQPDEVISVLRNGMTVIVRRVASPVVSVRGYSHTGGVYEGRWLGGGLSHLLEHLVAGGSTLHRTEAENRDLLQRIGNVSNAYTTYDHTCYFINTTPPHVEEALDLLTGWLLGAVITEEEYRREYQVVQRELEQGRGDPRRQFWYLSAMNRYRVNPTRVPVIGYLEVIQGLSRDDVYEYYRLTYQPNNLVLSIAGDVDPEQVLATVQRLVADAAPGREFVREVPEEPPVQGPRTLVATFPQLGRAQLELAFATIRLDHPDLYALDVLATVLGWGEGALLVEEVRDRQRLVSSIRVGSWTPHWVDGTFYISMELQPEQIADASAAVLEQIERVKRDGIDQERLERAKTQTRAARVRQQQTAESIASSLAIDLMSTGDPHFSDRYVERIMAVTADQVQAMAQRYLNPEVLLTTAMLPAEFVGAAGLPSAVELMRPVAPTAPLEPMDVETPVTRLELDNGTVLLHKRIATSPLVAVQMYSLGGLTTEDEQTNGLGNLAMQSVMRGTEQRSASEIARFMDSIGGEMSATCGNNTWYWSATFLREDIDNAFEVYADIVLNPVFPEDEVAAMKQRTIAQIRAQDANWTGAAMRFFRRAFYGPRQSPYQFQTTGTVENVEQFTHEQVRQWYEAQVLTAPRVLAVFGDIELEHARQLAEAHLGGGERLPPQPQRPVYREVPPVEIDRPRIEVTRVEVQQTEHPVAGVVIGFEADSIIGDPANDVITVGDTMASGFTYPTGYLHETLRGRGLVYVVHAQNWPGRGRETPGTFMAYAGCDPAEVNQVVSLMLENIARLQGSEQDMQPGWFERSKQLIITNDAMSNETAAEQAMTASLDELYGLGYDHHERFAERIEEVELEQLRQVARQRLGACVVTISTPRPDLVNVEAGEREYEEFHPVDLTPRGVEHAPVGAPR